MTEYVPCLTPEEAVAGENGWVAAITVDGISALYQRFAKEVRIETTNENFDIHPGQVVKLTGEKWSTVEVLSPEDAAVELVRIYRNNLPQEAFTLMHGTSASSGKPVETYFLVPAPDLPFVLVGAEHQVSKADLKAQFPIGEQLAWTPSGIGTMKANHFEGRKYSETAAAE